MVGRANRMGNFEGVTSKTKGERGTESVFLEVLALQLTTSLQYLRHD